MSSPLIVFIVLSLFGLSGLQPVESVYGSNAGNTDIGLSSEEVSSIRDFKEQTKQSIEEANLLIKNKELDRAKKELENILNLVKGKISVYEDKAKTAVSEEKKDNAKIYFQEASFLGKTVVQISKSLQEIEKFEIESKIERSKACLANGDFSQAQTLLEETLKLLPEQENSKKRQVESLIASIPSLREKSENKKRSEESAYYAAQGFENLETDRLDEAEINFRKALDILSDNHKATDGLAQVEKIRRRIYAQRVANLLEEARNNIRVEAFDEAEKELQEVLTLESDNHQAQSYLSEIEELRQAKVSKDLLASIDQKVEEGKDNLNMGRFEEAETSFNGALNLLPSDDNARRKKIESLLASVPELKQKYQARAGYERIEKIVTEAREQTEENKLVELIKQGKDYLIDSNFEEAKIKFLEASKIRPENELALQYLAETEQAKKEYENRKVLDKTENLIAEGKKYLEAEQLDKADANFRQALKMSPSEEKKLEIQSLLNDIDKAKQTIYNRKLQKQADEYIASGVENLKNNQYAKARTNFEKALAVKPDYSEAEKWLIRLEKAQEETNQNKLQTMMMEGKECLKNNQFDAARAKFEEILKIDPSYPEALSCLDMIEKAKGEYKNQQQFEKIKVVIDNGMKYLAEGQFDKAESTFKEAVEMAPLDMRGQTVKTIEEEVNSFVQKGESQKRADKYISDGIICLNNNEFDKAEEAFKLALNIIPEYSRGKEYLQRLEIAKLKYQSNQSLGQIDSTIGESEELKKAELENNVSQLMEQIKSKIKESEKVLEREN